MATTTSAAAVTYSVQSTVASRLPVTLGYSRRINPVMTTTSAASGCSSPAFLVVSQGQYNRHASKTTSYTTSSHIKRTGLASASPPPLINARYVQAPPLWETGQNRVKAPAVCWLTAVNPASPSDETSRLKTTDATDKCVICGRDVSGRKAGHYYGMAATHQRACNACGVFFAETTRRRRRTLDSEQDVTGMQLAAHVNREGQADTSTQTSSTRSSSSGRYQRCLEVGMRVDLVKPSRDADAEPPVLLDGAAIAAQLATAQHRAGMEPRDVNPRKRIKTSPEHDRSVEHHHEPTSREAVPPLIHVGATGELDRHQQCSSQQQDYRSERDTSQSETNPVKSSAEQPSSVDALLIAAEQLGKDDGAQTFKHGWERLQHVRVLQRRSGLAFDESAAWPGADAHESVQEDLNGEVSQQRVPAQQLARLLALSINTIRHQQQDISQLRQRVATLEAQVQRQQQQQTPELSAEDSSTACGVFEPS